MRIDVTRVGNNLCVVPPNFIKPRGRFVNRPYRFVRYCSYRRDSPRGCPFSGERSSLLRGWYIAIGLYQFCKAARAGVETRPYTLTKIVGGDDLGAP